MRVAAAVERAGERPRCVFGSVRYRSVAFGELFSVAGRAQRSSSPGFAERSVDPTVLLSTPAAFLLEESVSSSGPLGRDSPPH